MRLLEFASADDLLKLWQIVSQNVFAAVEKERREAEEAQRLLSSKPKKSRAVRSPSRSVSAVKAMRPKIVKPQVAKSQAAKPQTVSMQKSPQMNQVARPLMQQPQVRTQLPIAPKITSVQPTTRWF